VSIKTKIYRGPFQAVFKANYNASDKESLSTNTIDFESYDIELVGEKKYSIESIKTINGINTEKFIPGGVSRHSSVLNVETLYPKEENLKFNPINKNWSSLVIHNPEIPKESITIKEDGVFYGIIKGEAFHFERIVIPKANTKKEIKDEIKPVSVMKSKEAQEKPCFDRDSCFGEDGYLSTSRPMFGQNGCFGNRSNGCLYPNSNSCYGSSIGCFNAQPFPCYGSPCFSSCFPGCFGGCYSGCLPGCFQIPLLRFLLNLLGLLGLFYFLFMILTNTFSNETIIPNPIKEDDMEIVEEDIIEDDNEIIEETVIEEIEDTDHQILTVGEGNKVYLTVGDFDLEDKDKVNLFFNDIPIQMDYELINSPQNIELSNLKINQINTLRVEAVSDGLRGVCTPQVYACHICGGSSNCAPTMQLELKSKVENKNIGEITFFIEEQDCLTALLEQDNTLQENLINSYYSISDNIRVKEKMEYWSDSPEKYWNLQNPSKSDIEESLKKYFNSNKKVNYNINGIKRINSKQLQVKLEVAFDSNNIVDKEFNVIIVFDDENKITSEYQIDK
jgi:hypothetical protein